ncbi:hypothetical protein [Azospirillum picis]|uniref:PepSY domain-containing protein n=1 Tax=Azospirillum picis TaxID=488438 RepID=A0ABU0MU15_9PROT|nr:hypothetical protein [Azospirillum picis]MBP2303190.1 hypothetical protein [Azospirillum picis]MDQ0536942.1 hypothetical protein [Azospirillum picis]
MLRKTLAALLFGLALAATPSAGQSASPQSGPVLPVFDPENPPRIDAGPLAPGATAFTESQARRWLMRAGLSNIMDLTLGDDGIWRGQAERQGNVFPVSLDRNGDIATH